MIKILADECIHLDLITALKKAGFDVKTASEAKLSGKSDEAIFRYTTSVKRALLTFDRGFGDIFRFNILNSPGVIILLISQMNKEETLKIPLAFLATVKSRNLAGKLVIIGKKRIRISQR